MGFTGFRPGRSAFSLLSPPFINQQSWEVHRKRIKAPHRPEDAGGPSTREEYVERRE
jgi:hypothetical protein